MSKKKYPCGMAKDKVCEFAGRRRFDCGPTTGICEYCRKSKRFVFALKSCPIETAPNTTSTGQVTPVPSNKDDTSGSLAPSK